VSPEHSSELLPVIAAVRQRFLDAAVALTRERAPGIHSASSGMDCRAYTSGTSLEFWLEMEAPDRLLCWWLEAAREAGEWRVWAAVLANPASGASQETLREIADVRLTIESELGESLLVAADSLLATVRSGEFHSAAAV
jgi:hypothetical protein